MTDGAPSGRSARAPLSDADAKFVAAKLDAMFEGHCPHCGKPVERERQAGHCVYGEPCGHRLYQGRVGAFKKSEPKP